jgi:hypothetical protein
MGATCSTVCWGMALRRVVKELMLTTVDAVCLVEHARGLLAQARDAGRPAESRKDVLEDLDATLDAIDLELVRISARAAIPTSGGGLGRA